MSGLFFCFFFRNEIDLDSLKPKLKLILVDHNVLADAYSYLEPYVVEVLDHHKLERTSSCAKLTVEPVGSCCTLIAHEMLNRFPRMLDVMQATLLLGI